MGSIACKPLQGDLRNHTHACVVPSSNVLADFLTARVLGAPIRGGPSIGGTFTGWAFGGFG